MVMDDLLPGSWRGWRLLPEVENHLPGRYSWFPSAPHRMTATAHEEARRLNHPICNLGPSPVYQRITKFFLEFQSQGLSLGSHTLLVARISLEEFLLRLIIKHGRKINLANRYS